MFDERIRELVRIGYINEESFWDERRKLVNDYKYSISQQKCDEAIQRQIIKDLYDKPDFFELYLLNRRVIKHFMKNTNIKLMNIMEDARTGIKQLNAYDDDLPHKEYIDKAMINFKVLERIYYHISQPFWYYLELDSCHDTGGMLWCYEYVREMAKIIKSHIKLNYDNRYVPNIIAFGSGANKLSYHLNTYLKKYAKLNVLKSNTHIEPTKPITVDKQLIRDISSGGQVDIVIMCGQFNNLKYLFNKCHKYLPELTTVGVIGCNNIVPNNRWMPMDGLSRLKKYQYCHHDTDFHSHNSNTSIFIKKEKQLRIIDMIRSIVN